MGKKKFFETKVGKILKGAASVVAPGLVKTLEGVGSIGEAVQTIRNSSELSPEDKIKLETILIEVDAEEAKEITKRWEADAHSDSWLSKNVRPLVFICLFASLILFTLLDSFDFGFHVEPKWVDLWTNLGFVVFGGYFGARSVEKVTKMRMK